MQRTSKSTTAATAARRPRQRLVMLLASALLVLLAFAAAPLARAQGTGTGNAGTGNNNNNNNNSNGNANGNQAATTAAPSSTRIPDSAPIGGITITQPAETAEASYYKIAPGALITFGWNFTDVIATPSTLFVDAVCTKNGNTYSLAGPTGIPGNARNFTWDPYSYYQNAAASTLPALIQATYRLYVRDPQVTANGPGLMAANSRVQFALYIPQAYTPLASGWFCADCSGAYSLQSAHPLLLALLATAVVMLAGGSSVFARAASASAASASA